MERTAQDLHLSDVRGRAICLRARTDARGKSVTRDNNAIRLPSQRYPQLRRSVVAILVSPLEVDHGHFTSTIAAVISTKLHVRCGGVAGISDVGSQESGAGVQITLIGRPYVLDGHFEVAELVVRDNERVLRQGARKTIVTLQQVLAHIAHVLSEGRHEHGEKEKSVEELHVDEFECRILALLFAVHTKVGWCYHWMGEIDVGFIL
ncbi:hypothetical protein FGB62_49g215 [Gracilaria domingensis]|nr:hypothetical protein FGB62_49g215 [Gracilaria domingensis]